MGKIKNCFKKVGDWCVDNFELVLLGGIAISGLTVGYILGKDHGYLNGLNEFRETHIEIVKDVVDSAGCIAAGTALDLVKDPETYEKLLVDRDSVLRAVGDEFYKTSYIQGLMDSLVVKTVVKA